MFNLYLWIFAEICGLLSLVTTFWMCGARYAYIVHRYVCIYKYYIYIYIIIVPLYSLYKLHIHRPKKENRKEEKERHIETLLLGSTCEIASRHCWRWWERRWWRERWHDDNDDNDDVKADCRFHIASPSNIWACFNITFWSNRYPSYLALF